MAAVWAPCMQRLRVSNHAQCKLACVLAHHNRKCNRSTQDHLCRGPGSNHAVGKSAEASQAVLCGCGISTCPATLDTALKTANSPTQGIDNLFNRPSASAQRMQSRPPRQPHAGFNGTQDKTGAYSVGHTKGACPYNCPYKKQVQQT